MLPSLDTMLDYSWPVALFQDSAELSWWSSLLGWSNPKISLVSDNIFYFSRFSASQISKVQNPLNSGTENPAKIKDSRETVKGSQWDFKVDGKSINDLADQTDWTLTMFAEDSELVVRWTCQEGEISYRETSTGWNSGQQQLCEV